MPRFFSPPFLSLFPPILGCLDATDIFRLETHFKFSATGSRPRCVCAANTLRCLLFWSDNTVLQMKQPKRNACTHRRGTHSALSHKPSALNCFIFCSVSLRSSNHMRWHSPFFLSFFLSFRSQMFARQPPVRSPTP